MELADVLCFVTRRPDESESTDVIVSDGRFSIRVSDDGTAARGPLFVGWDWRRQRKQIFFFWRKRRVGRSETR